MPTLPPTICWSFCLASFHLSPGLLAAVASGGTRTMKSSAKIIQDLYQEEVFEQKIELGIRSSLAEAPLDVPALLLLWLQVSRSAGTSDIG